MIQTFTEEAEADETSSVTIKHVLKTPHLRRGLVLGIVAFFMQCASGIYATSTFSTYFFIKAGMSQVH